jgi:polysaccharide export outer membrane protein
MLNNFFQKTTRVGIVLTAAMVFLAGCRTAQPRVSHFDEKVAAKERAASLVLHEGDTIRIDFPGAPNLNTVQAIRRDGKITIEPVGEIQAAGYSPHELEQQLLKLFDEQLVEKEVNVSVVSSAFQIYVTGAVGRTGKLISDHVLTPLEAVIEAGIDQQKSNLKNVTVIRIDENGDTKRFKLDLDKVLKLGDRQDPFTLKPLDIIFVPEKFQWL